MTRPKRIRKARSVTLNPEAISRLLEVGAARTLPETNLSRLIDEAIEEYLERRWPAKNSERKK